MDAGLVTDLLKQLGSFTADQQALQELQLPVGVDDEVKRLQHNLAVVQAMLSEVEERTLTDPAVKPWYDQLKDAYYMMDDLLDIWNTARIKSQIQKEEEVAEPADISTPAVRKTVCSFIPSPSCCFNLPMHHDVGGKIKTLNETLDMIINGMEKYGIDLNRQPEVVDRPITNFVGENEVFGLIDYKKVVLEMLLINSSEETNPLVISLVGMGSIGKSTFAQLVYNDSHVQFQFDKRMWVCVSDPFDPCKVAKAIIESIQGQSPDITELQSLLDNIFDLIVGKKFFLVLDDVWTEDSTMWEPFKNALKWGAQGSRILITTRNERVAKMMDSSYVINLPCQPLDISWQILRRMAFHDRHEALILKKMGHHMVKKCKGLPLAVKTLGSLLRFKSRREQWQMVLNSSLWEFEDIEKGFLAPLLLSYYDLPSPLKQCFSYCAILPKDYLFSIDELILHWMAQGYIESKEDIEMEILAEEYFKILAMRCFFQDFEKNEDDNDKIISCKMHDIVHDFAQSMTHDLCFTIEGDEKVEIDFKKARQLSLIVKETIPEFVYDANNLRFLNLILLSSHTIPPKLFNHLTCLRTLQLEGKSILELPNEVEKLIHLRLLKLSCVNIKELPETMCNFLNLQSLDVRGCNELVKLPRGMSKLINLRHLLLDKKCGIKSFSKGIGRLTCLRTLTYFSVGGESDEICKMGELENLNHIQGSLRIQGLKNVVDLGEVKRAQLKKKIRLSVLLLHFDMVDEETEDRRGRRVEKDVSVLNALVPHPDLKDLTIGEYMGTTVCPNWMMSLTKLKRFVLHWCPNLECLPPLGKLPFLESLEILHADSLKKVGDEFLGIEPKGKNMKDDVIFPKLKYLDFQYLQNWEEWTGMGVREEEDGDTGFVTNPIKIMPNLELHSLIIEHCPKLKSLPDFLKIRADERGTGEEWPKISHIPNIRIGYEYVQRKALSLS
ncbi:putative disease resistance protein RGA3 [Quercus suber]|uniref:putative disease resistance protein RGA3 n=1 Tax=Quercus suber TaxID=58331 RepID=UPI000CE281EF|nr:putative disease resistance protein RGA3 [Quercus suber]